MKLKNIIVAYNKPYILHTKSLDLAGEGYVTLKKKKSKYNIKNLRI